MQIRMKRDEKKLITEGNEQKSSENNNDKGHESRARGDRGGYRGNTRMIRGTRGGGRRGMISAYSGAKTLDTIAETQTLTETMKEVSTNPPKN